jgi:hypothetical protein
MPEPKAKSDEQENPEQFFRPDEADRIARAQGWIRQARGFSTAIKKAKQR